VESASRFDRMIVSSQLQRPARGLRSVSARCMCGYPQVVLVSPVLEDGEPFPTIFWLTCPQFIQEISQMESTGLIKDIDSMLGEESAFRDRLMDAHKDYAEIRNSLFLQGPKSSERARKAFEGTGIGGVRRLDTAKCLHLHFAHYLAGKGNPIGELTKSMLLDEPMVEERCACFCRRFDMRQTMLASIDIGTNSTRLLVAQFNDDGDLEKISSDVHITRLGEGVNETGSLMSTAIDRTVDVLKSFKADMQRLDVERYKAVGTSALRDASNSKKFLDLARDVGVEIDIISGNKEAQLSYIGAVIGAETAQSSDRRIAVLDIGGGSTEVGLGTGGVFKTVNSECIGAVRMTEAFLKSDPPLEDEMSSLETHVDYVLARMLSSVCDGDVELLIGVGGTITSVVAMCEELAVYDPDIVHGYVLKREQVRELLGKLSKLNIDERRCLPGLQPGRADVIVAGVAILKSVMTKLNISELKVSETDILYGMFYDQQIRFHCV
jgi:exopolyphosphatase/guanosine-5'-triphosphate,3'-diphosphate pyrophosphatase